MRAHTLADKTSLLACVVAKSALTICAGGAIEAFLERQTRPHGSWVLSPDEFTFGGVLAGLKQPPSQAFHHKRLCVCVCAQQ